MVGEQSLSCVTQDGENKTMTGVGPECRTEMQIWPGTRSRGTLTSILATDRRPSGLLIVQLWQVSITHRLALIGVPETKPDILLTVYCNQASCLLTPGTDSSSHQLENSVLIALVAISLGERTEPRGVGAAHLRIIHVFETSRSLPGSYQSIFLK
ncbi:hypothetical protein RRG08_005487 [Elysia crispata]|uniref:Uncharacterized protein n=1 Tax=Elysia crispata TaxID=231223 RepID=A0AAE1CQN4_9GAST|nr:hypothetical protein RRG08_005487 [Elysia crispata]